MRRTGSPSIDRPTLAAARLRRRLAWWCAPLFLAALVGPRDARSQPPNVEPTLQPAPSAAAGDAWEHTAEPGEVVGDDLPVVRLRVEWGGGPPDIWTGILTVAGGALSDPQSLSIETDSTSTLRIAPLAALTDPDAAEPANEPVAADGLEIRRQTARTYDGFEVSVHAPVEAPLRLTLARPSGERHTINTTLLALVAQPLVEQLDEQGNRAILSRAPGDALPVQFPRDHLVFAPAELLRCRVALNLIQARREPVVIDFAWELAPARGGDPLAAGRITRNVLPNTARPATVPLEIDLPDAEGVYDLRLRLSPAGGPIQERSVQVVVIDDRPRAARLDLCRRVEVDHFEPARPGFRRQLGAGAGNEVHDVGGRRFLALGPNAGRTGTIDPSRPTQPAGPAAGDPSWAAFRLNVEAVGRPHVLLVETASSGSPLEPTTLGVSIAEPNALGQFVPLGLDSGIYVDAEPAPATGSRAHVELLFWPRTTEPAVLVTNRRDGSRPLVGNVVLYELREQAPTPARPSRSDARLAGPYLAKPLLPENFGGTEALDRVTGRSLDDWRTFYESARHLIDYLHYAGHNSLMLTVFADGSTLYPSRLLAPTPRYDTGIYFGTGQDPLRKDVLEMLLRMFDREGLVLVPAMDFSTPLPDLESLRSQRAAGAHAIDLVALDGQTWRDRSRGLLAGPLYNPLDSQVQEAVARAVEELAARYGRHPSFGGVALALGPESYLLFPGAEWGYDDPTITRFAAETGAVAVPAAAPNPVDAQRPEGPRLHPQAAPPNSLPPRGAAAGWGAAVPDAPTPPDATATTPTPQSLITPPLRARWLDWRCRELARFHQRLADAVQRLSRPGTVVYLAAQRLFERPIPGEPRPGDEHYQAIRYGAQLEELLRARGLEFARYGEPPSSRSSSPGAPLRYAPATRADEPAAPPNLRLLRPASVASADVLPGGRTDYDLNQSPELDALVLRSNRAGCLHFHPPYEARVAGFDSVAPWQPAYTWLVAQPLPAGTANARRLAHSIAALDASCIFDGGWLAPMGQEAAARDLLATFRVLPDVPFTTSPQSTQPVVVRTASAGPPDARRAYLYAVNDSPWPARVVLELDLDAATPHRLLGSTQSDAVRLEPVGDAGPNGRSGRSRLQLDLGPYDLRALVFDLPAVAVVTASVEPDPEGLAALAEQVRAIETRMAQIRDAAAPISLDTVLNNPGFEQMPPAGTRPATPPGWQVNVAHAWQLDPQDAHAGSRSLTLRNQGATVVLATPQFMLGGSASLEMTLWMRGGPQGSRVRLMLESTYRGRPYRREAVVDVTPQWLEYVFQVSRLPREGLGPARVHVVLEEPGDLWLDDVALRALPLADEESRQLTRTVSSIVQAWDDRRYSDCYRLVQGYWAAFVSREFVPPPFLAQPDQNAPEERRGLGGLLPILR